MEIYVGNLSFETTDSKLREAFERFGEVGRASVVNDRDTGRSRGFGFVEMRDADQAKSAIKSLNGSEVDGRAITVNEARPRQPRGNSGGYGGGRY